MSAISKTVSNGSAVSFTPRSAALDGREGREGRDNRDSLIFERSVEDLPALQASRSVSRAMSRAASRNASRVASRTASRSGSRSASRPVSRQPSQATLCDPQLLAAGFNGATATSTTSQMIHNPLPTKRTASYSFSSPSTDLRRYSTNPNPNMGHALSRSNNMSLDASTSTIRRVKTGATTYGSPPSQHGSPSSPSDSYFHTLENFVAPALDESCSIVTDKNTRLDDVDMIYSKRPSTLGLDMALGRTRSASVLGQGTNSPIPTTTAQPQRNHHRARSYYPGSECGGDASPSQSARLLRFYSYADMLNDENTHQQQQMNRPERPDMLSHNSYCNDERFDARSGLPQTQPQPQHPHAQAHTDSPSPAHSTSPSFFTNPFMRNRKERQQNEKATHRRTRSPGTLKSLRSKFHLHSDSSSSHDDDDEDYAIDDEMDSADESGSGHPHSRQLRKSASPGHFDQDDLYADQADVSTLSGASAPNSNNEPAQLDDVLQKERVSDVLRRRVSENQLPQADYGHGFLDRGERPPRLSGSASPTAGKQ
ncbi:Vhs2 protein [Maudiozyma humilis]|uniref:Vhs2 protein n=1 Tax=Maudiozyma humilis TaxID=51915 RepID=A0AAV5RZ80_MAUHU|nr:Vhs2 protein [Kazachstania humilis]